jgi:hypothetical protein
MKKAILSILLTLLFSCFTIAQTTTIPDANFEQALIDLGYDAGVPDGLVLINNIDTITVLDVGGLSIADLTGIEDFTALEVLLCRTNQLTSVDVSQNLTLINLQFYLNQLTTIELSQNTALEVLNSWQNPLTSLDVSQNTALTTLFCENNQLTCLNVKNGNNPNLINFNAQFNLHRS